MQQSSAQTRLFQAPARLAVLPPYPVAGAYDYALPPGQDHLPPGTYVRIPLGKRETVGVVWGAGDGTVAVEKLKPVATVFDLPPMPEKLMRFIDRMASYTLAPPGAVLKMALSVPGVFEPLKKRGLKVDFQTPDTKSHKVDLSAEQQSAAAALCDAVEAEKFQGILLDGVTGAGKTEVYFEAVARALDAGKQVMVLLPEIALSAQFLSRFEKRFGTKPALWHSGLTPAQRRETWRAVATGQVRVVAGARSALFLPFADLGLMIVDEEHDAAFKQEEGVIYNARDMAVLRAQEEKIPIVLVSATASLETMANARQGRYLHLELPSRFGGAQLPEIEIIDLKENRPERQRFLSPVLRDALAETLAARDQSLLFLNRRGYAPLTLCRACGFRLQCPGCTAWLVAHRHSGRLHCHHCSHAIKMPENCSSCGESDSWAACGPGVERIAEEVQEFLPDARVLVLSSDLTENIKTLSAAIARIENHEVDVIVGTQIVAKGHHFPNLTLVGVVDADLSLAGGDLRAGERTFQLLQQVAGRAGRAKKPGQVLLQSYMPENRVIQALAVQDRTAFYDVELQEREQAAMPPFGRLAGIVVSAKNETQLLQACRDLARVVPQMQDVRILGPAEPPLAIIRNRHRRRFLVKTGRNVSIQKVVTQWLAAVKLPSAVDVRVDIDPQSFF